MNGAKRQEKLNYCNGFDFKRKILPESTTIQVLSCSNEISCHLPLIYDGLLSKSSLEALLFIITTVHVEYI